MSDTPWMERQSLRDLCRHYRASHQSIGMTTGCFDILHIGHLNLLQSLRQRCSLVVVGLNSDVSVRRLKGDGRPFNSQSDRAEMLLGLKAVCLVGLIEEDNPCELVSVVRPNIYMKGGDYYPESLIERSTVVYYGGIVVRGPMVPGHSTTALAGRLTALNGQTERS